MFFVSRVINGKCGIVDTEDWVEDVYLLEDLERIKSKGIIVEGVEFQSILLGFLRTYICCFTEVGSGSCMDLVDSYLIDGDFSSLQYEIGSSTSDLVINLRDMYIELSKKWNDFDVSSLGRDNKLFDDVSRCVASEYSNDGSLQKNIDLLHKRYHFDKKLIKKSLWIL